MKKLLTFLFCVLPIDLLACRPNVLNAELEFENAESVAIYTVTDIVAANAEAILLGEEVDQDNAIFVPVERQIHAVKALDLKGKMEKLVVLDVGCSFASELLWDVAVFKKDNKIWHGDVSDDVLSKWREVATNKASKNDAVKRTF